MKIKIDKNKENVFKAFGNFFNVTTLLFLGFQVLIGLGWAIQDNFMFVYFQDLGASSAMIGMFLDPTCLFIKSFDDLVHRLLLGYFNTIASGAGLIVAPAAKAIGVKFGHLNMLYASMLFMLARHYLSVFIK